MQPVSLDYPPFDLLTESERQQLAQSADIAFFGRGEIIIPSGSSVDVLYIVIKGLVKESADNETVAAYRENEMFDAQSMVADHSHHEFSAYEETLLYALPRAAVKTQIKHNPHFGAYFYAGISEKIGALTNRNGHREWQSMLNSRINEININHSPILNGDTTIKDVAQEMKTNRLKSVLVQDNDRIGIFTTSDLRDVIIDGSSPHARLSQYAHFELYACDESDYLFNAMLTMTQHNVQRVVITHHGVPVNILEQIDLLSYFSNHSHLIAQRLEQAKTPADLHVAAQDIIQLIASLADHGMHAPQLAQLVQALNTQLMDKLWQMLTPKNIYQNSCLLILGSEGRGEQILRTDQDNALIYHPSLSTDTVDEVTAAFTDTLIKLGYPPCPGGVMVNQSMWRGTSEQWRERLYSWIYMPDDNSPLYLSIFLDAEPVCGRREWLDESKQYLTGLIQDDNAWFARLARPVEQFDHSAGLLSQWLNRDNQSGLDIKKAGIFPIVHGIRVMAMEAGITTSNTFDRIKALAQQNRLEQRLAKDAAEALSFFMNLRLKAGLEKWRLGLPADNRVGYDDLSTLERDLLKDALAVVKRFKTIIHHHFHLSAF